MSDVAIRVESLSKQYRIGERERYKALRDVLTNALYAPFRRLVERAPANGRHALDNTFWALKDVSFEIKRGEVVGVIGRNGAGKSTLLKILSRITEPTEGLAEIHGRVGSLLEVGTGFHPELTGRENIFLNGAVLGMKRAEITRKFDEIVAFAEVEKFIDTPVKHYSSGMHMRLAFSVAAHLEPEILLVDEVLAVGDAAFQKKCLGKMGEVGKQGRTVLLVTHQMNQIRRLCEQCIWLDGGRLRSTGATPQVIGAYEATIITSQKANDDNSAGSYNKTRFLSWEILEPRAEAPNILTTQGPLRVIFALHIQTRLRMGVHGIALFNNDNQLMWGAQTDNLELTPGRYELSYQIDMLPLRPGTYHWIVSIFDETGMVDQWNGLPALLVTTNPLNHVRDEWAGLLNIPYQLSVNKNPAASP
jgi:ABC-type polysaccharide/polyol phosphate transport system ATPase subunit